MATASPPSQSDTQSMDTGSISPLLALPVEIVIDILVTLDIHPLLTCRQVSILEHSTGW